MEQMVREIKNTLDIDLDILCPRKMTTSNKIDARKFYNSWKQRTGSSFLSSSKEYITIKADATRAPVFSAEYRNEHSCHFDNIDMPFDYANFGKPRHLPVSVGFVQDTKTFMGLFDNATIIQPQDMPIAFPTEIPQDYCFRLPECYKGAVEVIQQVANVWWSLSTKPHTYYCYLSASRDCIEPFMYQRRPGIHSDGFQSARFTAGNMVHQPCEFIFTVCNTLPTLFYLDSYDTSRLNPAKDNFFEYIASGTNGPAYDVQQPFEIYFMDGYCLHSSKCQSSSAENIDRIFMRLVFSTKVYDRLGNTINPHFDYKWEFMRREAQLDLSKRN